MTFRAGTVRRLGVLVVVVPALGFMLAGEAVAEKLIVFKNGKAMRANSVKEDGAWLRCEFEGGNFMSVPLRNVLSIEDAALLPAAGGFAANQLVDGPRGGANIPSGPDVSAPAFGAGRLGAGRQVGGAESDGGEISEDDAQRLAREEEAAALATQVPVNRNVGLQNSPIQGLVPLTQPINQAVSPGAGRRGIGRKRDRGDVTQLPDEDN